MSNAPNKECCCCSNLSCRKPEIKKEYPKKKLLTRAMESFYDNCAAYNLRYIPYRTVTDRRTCLKSVMKDFIVLFCFLMTNFIVLLTILSRITMHMSDVILVLIDWLRQVLVSKASPTSEETRSLYSAFSIKREETASPIWTPQLPTNESRSINCNYRSTELIPPPA